MENLKMYRIKEDINGFSIEIAYSSEIIKGKFWWKQTINKIIWKSLDEDGLVVFWQIGFESNIKKYYETLEEAQEAIEKFKKFHIYHYESENCDSENCGGCEKCFPNIPSSEPTKC
jgi:hypothetical protein